MNDEEQIRSKIQTYFDCMYESSSEKTHAAFHPSAKITGYLEDGLHEMTVKDFADFVSSQLGRGCSLPGSSEPGIGAGDRLEPRRSSLSGVFV